MNIRINICKYLQISIIYRNILKIVDFLSFLFIFYIFIILRLKLYKFIALRIIRKKEKY